MVRIIHKRLKLKINNMIRLPPPSKRRSHVRGRSYVSSHDIRHWSIHKILVPSVELFGTFTVYLNLIMKWRPHYTPR